MDFKLYDKEDAPTLMLIPGLGVSYEIFLPLIDLLESIHGADIHFWYGTLEAFVAKPQVEHLKTLCPDVQVEVFPKMNHGQLLVDHPEEVSKRILEITNDNSKNVGQKQTGK